MPRARRVDANQGALIAALRAAGATVEPLHRQGDGCPDLLVGYRAQNFLIEVKLPSEKASTGQRIWMEGWKGQACVAHTAEEALRSIGAMK